MASSPGDLKADSLSPRPGTKRQLQTMLVEASPYSQCHRSRKRDCSRQKLRQSQETSGTQDRSLAQNRQARFPSSESRRSRNQSRSRSRSGIGYRRRSKCTDSAYCSGDEDQSTYKGDIKTLYYIITGEDDKKYRKPSQASAHDSWPSTSPDCGKQEVF